MRKENKKETGRRRGKEKRLESGEKRDMEE